MKKTFLFFILASITIAVSAQSLKKYPVSNSGCLVYLFCEPTFDQAYSQDSSNVYTAECVKDSVSYGVICIKLFKAVDDISQAEDLVVSYLDYLKTTFEIAHAIGYGKGNRLNGNENTRGVIDYWEDKDHNNWKVKAWTNGKFVGVMYAYSLKKLPETKVDAMLNSFRFP